MEGRVLEVVVVCCYEDAKGDEGERDVEGYEVGFAVGEAGVACEGCGVDHGELIYELPGVWWGVSSVSA